MRPSRRASRAPLAPAHSRSNSSTSALGVYVDENAPSLIGPQRTQGALNLIHKATSSSVLSRASKLGTIPKELASKDTSSKDAATRPAARRVLGDVGGNQPKPVKVVEDFKPAKPIRSRNAAANAAPVSAAGLSTVFAKTLKVGTSATFGGVAAQKLASTLSTKQSMLDLMTKPAVVKPSRSLSTSNVTGSFHSQNFNGFEKEKVVEPVVPTIETVDDIRNCRVQLPEAVFEAVEAENQANTSNQDLLGEEEDDVETGFDVDCDDLTMAKTEVHSMPQSPEVQEDEMNWMLLSPGMAGACKEELLAIKEEFVEELDYLDPTMMAEYSEDIFKYMSEIEESTLPNPNYMDAQTEIEWEMRGTLIDWLLQVHMRYHMLPETLWIAVNLMDRFLSKRVVSLVKFQLVGVTSMFVAAKYEEIMAPSVEEFVYMTENGYTRDEILKGERIVLTTLDFNISSYCSPYSWLRRISKADDYDIQTRTLSKFLMEATLIDHRFLRAKPSMIAAIAMFTARRMLGGDWNEAFTFYSNYTESQLVTPMHVLMDILNQPGFKDRFVYKKYEHKKFLKASTFACAFASKYTSCHG